MAKVKVLEFKRIESTNGYLKQNYESLPSFSFVRADYQTKGMGQFNRRWYSSYGNNLLFSFLLKDVKFNQIITIKEWVKSSLFELLGSLGLDPYFKEPNDIFVNNKKICGILIETKSQKDSFSYVVVGVGLNVNQFFFPGLNATSVLLETKKRANIRKLFSRITTILLENYF